MWLALPVLALSALPVTGQTGEKPDGKVLFETVCAMCHSVQPPPKLAPAISHAAAYYLRKHASVDAAANAMVAFLKNPQKETSAIPPHAIERFGLMPAQAHLSDSQLQAVARYALTLADTAHVRGGMQHGSGH